MNYGLFSFEGLFFFALGMRLRISKFDWNKLSPSFGLAMLGFGVGVLILAATGKRFAVPMAKYLYFIYVPFLLTSFVCLMPEQEMPKVYQSFHFPLYLIHLNVVFVYFAMLSCGIGKKYASWFDPAVSCRGAFIGFVSVLLASALIFHVVSRFTRNHSLVNTILWGGRV